MKHLKFLVGLVMMCHLSTAQEVDEEIEQLRNQVANLRHSFDMVRKQLDDVLWYDKVGDVAYIDKVYLTGPPKADRVEKNKTRQGFGNPFRFQSYVLKPRGIDPSKKYP